MRIRDYKLFLESNQDINFIYQKYTDIDNDDISVTIRNSMKHIGLFESFHTDEKVGKEFWFEYHCWENEKSADAELWKHTHQKVTVLSISEYSHENLEDRISDGNPRTYKVRFEDGFEWDVFEDELLNSPEEYNRPDLGLEYVSESLKYLNINNINDYIFNENLKLYDNDGVFIGSPKYARSFGCGYNKLKTFEGGPESVMAEYYCYRNKLVNFKGLPEDFDGDIFISDNPVSKLLENIPDNKWNKFIYWCNELNAIDDNGNVNEEWMEEVHHKIGLEYNEED